MILIRLQNLKFLSIEIHKMINCFYEGATWYRKIFNFSPTSDKRQLLYFESANYETIVYLNGKKLGQNTGGFTPLQFEVTDSLKERKNRMNGYVNHRRKANCVSLLKFDW